MLDSQTLYSLPTNIQMCVRGVNSYGIYINNDDSAQYEEGSDTLQPGDYVSSIDDQLINEFADVSQVLADKKVGESIKITVYRYDSTTRRTSQITVSIILTERKS